jgi:hypothetical protein
MAVERTEREPKPMRPYVNTVIPVVGQFGGGAGGFPATFGPPYVPFSVWETTHVAIRHGPVKVWYASGQLQLKGGYQDDLRDGLWTHYDEQGRVSEQGQYQADLREGDWLVSGTAPGQTSKPRYVGGLPRETHDALLAPLADDLAGGSTSRKIAAAEQLPLLGPRGIAALAAALASKDQETLLLALRALGRQDALPDEGVELIAPLANHAEPRIALRARLALYVARPSERSKLFLPLAEALGDADDDRTWEGFWAIYHAGPDHRAAALGPLVYGMANIEAKYQSGTAQHRPNYFELVADLGWEVIPQLEEIFPHASAEERWFIVRVLQTLVARGKLVITETASGRAVNWPIPEQARPLLERAKADADPNVKQAADQVGRQRSGGGLGGAGGFF